MTGHYVNSKRSLRPPRPNAVNLSRPRISPMEPGLELTGLVAREAAIGSDGVDGAREVPDQGLQEALSITGLCTKKSHEIVLHRRECTATAHLISQLAMREVNRPFGRVRDAETRCQRHSQVFSHGVDPEHPSKPLLAWQYQRSAARRDQAPLPSITPFSSKRFC